MVDIAVVWVLMNANHPGLKNQLISARHLFLSTTTRLIHSSAPMVHHHIIATTQHPYLCATLVNCCWFLIHGRLGLQEVSSLSDRAFDMRTALTQAGILDLRLEESDHSGMQGPM